MQSSNNETMQLYITPSSFVLANKSNILEIDFEGHTMTKRGTELWLCVWFLLMLHICRFVCASRDYTTVRDLRCLGILWRLSRQVHDSIQSIWLTCTVEKYMVVISSVQLCGHIMDHPIYMITAVNCLSLSSHQQSSETTEEEQEPIEPRPVELTKSKSFLTRIKKTFSKKNELPQLLDNDTLVDNSSSSVLSSNSSTTSSLDDQDIGLEQRLVKQVTEMFSRNMFLFSYTWDITNSFQRSTTTVPNVDKRFWWNEHLARDFITQKVIHMPICIALTIDEYIVGWVGDTCHAGNITNWTISDGRI